MCSELRAPQVRPSELSKIRMHPKARWRQINRVVSNWIFGLAKRWQFYTLRLQSTRWPLRETSPSLAMAGVGVGVESISLEPVFSKSLLGMPQTSQERRMMRRFDMRLPAVVRLGDAGDFHTETQNVSARGVFLYLDRRRYRKTRCSSY